MKRPPAHPLVRWMRRENIARLRAGDPTLDQRAVAIRLHISAATLSGIVRGTRGLPPSAAGLVETLTGIRYARIRAWEEANRE